MSVLTNGTKHSLFEFINQPVVIRLVTFLDHFVFFQLFDQRLGVPSGEFPEILGINTVRFPIPEERFILGAVEIELGAYYGVLLQVRTLGRILLKGHIPIWPEALVDRRRHINGFGADLMGLLAKSFRTNYEDGIIVRFLNALLEFPFHHFVAKRKYHVTPDTFDVRFGKKPFHFILKFLSYEVVLQNRDDQDFLEFWHGLVPDPVVNNFRVTKQWGNSQEEKGEPEKECVCSISGRPKVEGHRTCESV